MSTFDARPFESALIDDRALSSRDRWAFVDKRLKLKERELEDDLELKSKRPSSLFVIHSVAAHNGDKKQLSPANVRRAKRSSRFAFYSIDALSDYEATPAASFEPSFLDRDKLYALQQSDGASHDSASSVVAIGDARDEQRGDYAQGAHDNAPVFVSSSAQIGVSLTFAPPMKGYALQNGASLMLRRAFTLVVNPTRSDAKNTIL